MRYSGIRRSNEWRFNPTDGRAERELYGSGTFDSATAESRVGMNIGASDRVMVAVR